MRWGDLAVVGLALGQFIGRWGIFQSRVVRASDRLAVGIAIDHPLAGFESFTNFHPAFLYESLWNLLAFVVLYYLAAIAKTVCCRVI